MLPIYKFKVCSFSLCRTSCCIAPIAGLAGKWDQSRRKKRPNVVGCDKSGERKGKKCSVKEKARRSRGLLTAALTLGPRCGPVQLI